MFHATMSTASIRELRTSFPKNRARLDREGQVIITDRGKAAFLLTTYQAPKKPRRPRIDYYARLLSYMPKPMSAAAMRAMDADRDDR